MIGRHVDTIACTGWSATDTGLASGRDELDRFDICAIVSLNCENAFARFERELRAIEQWMCAECEFGTQEREQRHD